MCLARDQNLKYEIFLLAGAYAALTIPKNAFDQFSSGSTGMWNLDTSSPIIGSHYVYLYGWDKDALTCVTWGRAARASEALA